MKIPLFCMSCSEEEVASSLILSTLAQDGVYPMRCLNGHETATRVQQSRFELLFELGMHAIVDGYYREAVSSCTAALERFGELYLEVACERRGIAREHYDTSWKMMAKQSERQLGAFVLAHLMETHEPLRYLPEKQVAFRNRVVHQGEFPSRDQAVSYANDVLGVITPVLLRLKSEARDVLVHVATRHLVWMPDGKTQSPTVLSVPTIVSVTRGASSTDPEIEEWLARIASSDMRGIQARQVAEPNE